MELGLGVVLSECTTKWQFLNQPLENDFWEVWCGTLPLKKKPRGLEEIRYSEVKAPLIQGSIIIFSLTLWFFSIFQEKQEKGNIFPDFPDGLCMVLLRVVHGIIITNLLSSINNVLRVTQAPGIGSSDDGVVSRGRVCHLHCSELEEGFTQRHATHDDLPKRKR